MSASGASSTTAFSDGASITDYISRSDQNYSTQLLANKVFINVPSLTLSKNLLDNSFQSQVIEYDSFFNALLTINNYGGAGTKATETVYDNNPGSGYIGRPTSVVTTMNNGTDNFTTTEEIAYTGFLPTQIRKKGNGTPFNIEDLVYDVFGNVTSKTITVPGGAQRSASMGYDPTGRFLITSTDAEGKTTTSTFDSSTGNVLTITNVFGQTETYLYDGWGRKIKSTDYLGANTVHTYLRDNSNVIVNVTDDEGRGKSVVINALGQTTEEKAKTVLGNFIGRGIQYDVYGRKTGESQPGQSGNYTQWDNTIFDAYGRISQVVKFTGKTTAYAYNGLSTTVNDGVKSITTTKNALGQIVSVQDPGGTISYSYFANGNLRSSSYAGLTQAVEQDGWGRRTKLTDPSGGVYSTEYDGFSQPTKEITPKGTIEISYDGSGKILTKKIAGDNTLMQYAYSYDGTTKLMTGLSLTNADGNDANYSYTYDSNKRISSTVEDNLHAKFTKTYTYDNYGRISNELYEAKDKLSNITSSKGIEMSYQNGQLLQTVQQGSGKILWKIDNLDSRGQLTTALQSTTLKTNFQNDQYGLPQQQAIEKIASTPVTLMNIGYGFDAQRGILTSRSNSAFSWSESFSYDNQDRLTNFNDNNGNNNQQYDNRGRITDNSDVGVYSYDGNSYKLNEVALNSSADAYYQARSLQQISYNAFNSPVQINEPGTERLDFQYNAEIERAHMYFGDEQVDKMLRRFRRHYSEDGHVEITNDLQTGKTSFVFYLSGDAYTAPAIFKEEYLGGNLQSGNLYYLHRDYLGSIVMITDDQGGVVEKRQFDAWGNLVKLQDGFGNNLSTFQIIDRGFTGHEHLTGVKLINMNARLYDSKLHRFLSPDNFVQDLYNTQNYNRYGYAMNNPLMYTDPTGHFFWLPIIIGAILGAYTGGTLANNGQFNPFKWDYSSGKTWGYMLGGALIGGAAGFTGGSLNAAIGANLHTNIAGLVAGAAGGAAAGAISGGGFALLAGGNVLDGIWKGAVSGLVGGALGSYVSGAEGALAGGAAAAATSATLSGGSWEDIGLSSLIGGIASYGLYQLQTSINYAKYKADKGTFTRRQFATISKYTQRSFARGKEYGGFIMDDGTVQMRFEEQTRSGVNLGLKPKEGISGYFHTHPNWGNGWVPQHSPQDLMLNRVVYQSMSYVFGRQDIYSMFYRYDWLKLFDNKLFNPYPFNTHFFSF